MPLWDLDGRGFGGSGPERRGEGGGRGCGGGLLGAVAAAAYVESERQLYAYALVFWLRWLLGTGSQGRDVVRDEWLDKVGRRGYGDGHVCRKTWRVKDQRS